jgi:hypothetical protein
MIPEHGSLGRLTVLQGVCVPLAQEIEGIKLLHRFEGLKLDILRPYFTSACAHYQTFVFLFGW